MFFPGIYVLYMVTIIYTKIIICMYNVYRLLYLCGEVVSATERTEDDRTDAARTDEEVRTEDAEVDEDSRTDSTAVGRDREVSTSSNCRV